MTTFLNDLFIREYPGGVSARAEVLEDDGENLKREVEQLRERKCSLERQHTLALMAKVEVLQRKIKRPSLLKYLPAGEFVFRPSDPPVIVTSSVAAMIEGNRLAIVSAGHVPYFGFDHRDGPAAFYPFEFHWQAGVDGGVWCTGHWTREGLAAYWSGQRQYFSPTFPIDGTKYQRPITCMVGMPPNMGALCAHAKFGETMRLNPDLVR